jgi:cullin 2
MSEVEVKLNYLKSIYTITMNTFQVAMLIAFQHTDAVTCEELLKATCSSWLKFKQVFQPSIKISLNMLFSNQRSQVCVESCPEVCPRTRACLFFRNQREGGLP